MKKLFFAVAIILLCHTLNAQNTGVEKSLFSVQIGLLGAWASNETKLGADFVLRTEVGLDAGLFGGDNNNNVGVFLTPVITLEPRWYYNLSKRESKGKNTSNNSANFFTTSISYHPDWFVISGTNNVMIYNQLAFIPKWGIRRSIAKSNFNFEAGIGLGYRVLFLKQYGFENNQGETALDLHVRFGYTFKKKTK